MSAPSASDDRESNLYRAARKGTLKFKGGSRLQKPLKKKGKKKKRKRRKKVRDLESSELGDATSSATVTDAVAESMADSSAKEHSIDSTAAKESRTVSFADEVAAGDVGDEIEEKKADSDGKKEKSKKAFKSGYETALEKLTPSQKAFLLRQKANEEQFILKQIEMSHRQKIEQFNQKLGNLSEHYDIPKVGPG